MKSVGVSIFAFPSGCLLFPPLWLPLKLLFLCYPPLWLLFLASSTRIFLPMCSIPLSSKALLNDNFDENLTKAKPFGFPSGLEINLTFKIFPQSLNKSLTSPSNALKESPWTATSNSPCSSYYYYSILLAGTCTGCCLPLGFWTTSSSSDSGSIFFGAGFFLAGWGCSSSDY